MILSAPLLARGDLALRPVLPLDPRRAIAIKRDVQHVDVDAPAIDLARALAAALAEPGARFGHIRVLRSFDAIGRPFALGERFQGAFDLAHAVARHEHVAPSLSRALRLVEDLAFSDYAVVTELDVEGAARPGGASRLTYQYLEGTPIAGSFSMECHATGASGCRVTATTVYQEVNLASLVAFGTVVLPMHNEVFFEAVQKAAARLRAPVRGSSAAPPAPVTRLDARREASIAA